MSTGRPSEVRHGGRVIGSAVEPAPHRPGEAGVVHGPVPAGAVEVEAGVVAVLGEQPAVGPRPPSIVRRTARATWWARSSAPSRPVMLATSTRQPSRPSRSQWATTESGPSYSRRASSADRCGRAWAAWRWPSQRRSVASSPSRTGRSRARGWSGRSAPARTSRGSTPVWLVVRSPTTRRPAACAASSSADERGVAAEQRVDAVERDGVVAVVGAGLEDRGQVEQRRAEVGQVVEPLA